MLTPAVRSPLAFPERKGAPTQHSPSGFGSANCDLLSVAYRVRFLPQLSTIVSFRSTRTRMLSSGERSLSDSMSYDHGFLFRQIVLHVAQQPAVSVRTISQKLNVSCRTVQGVIRREAGGSLRELRRQALFAKTVELFSTDPGLAIKQVSFAVGFASPRSFARAIRRITGISPECLRSRVLAGQGLSGCRASVSTENLI